MKITTKTQHQGIFFVKNMLIWSYINYVCLVQLGPTNSSYHASVDLDRSVFCPLPKSTGSSQAVMVRTCCSSGDWKTQMGTETKTRKELPKQHYISSLLKQSCSLKGASVFDPFEKIKLSLPSLRMSSTPLLGERGLFETLGEIFNGYWMSGIVWLVVSALSKHRS